MLLTIFNEKQSQFKLILLTLKEKKREKSWFFEPLKILDMWKNMSDRETQLSKKILFQPPTLPETGLDLRVLLAFLCPRLMPSVSFYQRSPCAILWCLLWKVIFYEWQYENGGFFFPASWVKPVSFWLNGERALSVGYLLKGDGPSEYDNISV